jgi:hypothetical protein
LATAEFRPFLEQARATPLRAWVTNVSPISPLHEIERLLRVELARRTDEIATWLPKELHAAIEWTGRLIDLPAVDYLLNGGPALPWMLDDEHLKPIAATEPETRATVLAQSALAPLAREPGDLAARWLVEWRRRLPRLTRDAQRRLARLVDTVQAHRAAIAPPPVQEPLPARAAWELRRQLERRVVRHFRAGFLEATAVFAYLVLQALEFERVRGELVSRLLFARETR